MLEENNQTERYDVYFKLGELMVTMLYSWKFKITADKCDMRKNRRKNNSQSYFVIETNDNYNIAPNDYSSFMFLNCYSNVNTYFHYANFSLINYQHTNTYSNCNTYVISYAREYI